MSINVEGTFFWTLRQTSQDYDSFKHWRWDFVCDGPEIDMLKLDDAAATHSIWHNEAPLLIVQNHSDYKMKIFGNENYYFV